MYVTLNKCRVRGSVHDGFYLQSLSTGASFELEKIHAEILWHCNGKLSTNELARKFSQPHEDVLDFLKIFENEGLVSFSDFQNQVEFASLLLEDGMPYLEEIQLEITSKCNLWCKHCYGREEFATMDKDHLSISQISNLIHQMSAMNVAHCFLSGGEVFLHKQLPLIIEEIIQNNISLQGIFTNGTIWRDDVFETCQKLKIKPTILVSLDGAQQKTHDYIRGSGTFKKTLNFIKEVKKLGHRVTINTIVMKPNVHEFSDMFDLLESIGIDRWRLAVPREQGEAIVNSDSIIPEWSDVFDVYEALLRRGLSNTNGMKLQLSSIFKTEFALDGKYYLIGDNNGCCDYKRSSLVLKPNGDLLNCPASAKFPLGNIKKDALRDTWQRDKTQFFKTLPVKKTACKNCDVRQYCGSGCRIIAWQLHADYLAKDENSCPLYYFFRDRIRPIFQEFGIEEVSLPQNKDLFRFSKSDIQRFIGE